MSRDQIIDQLRDILADTCGTDKLERSFREDARLMEDIGLSSVEILYLIIAVEESFQIRFENVGIRDLPSVGDVADYIEARLS